MLDVVIYVYLFLGSSLTKEVEILSLLGRFGWGMEWAWAFEKCLLNVEAMRLRKQKCNENCCSDLEQQIIMIPKWDSKALLIQKRLRKMTYNEVVLIYPAIQPIDVTLPRFGK